VMLQSLYCEHLLANITRVEEGNQSAKKQEVYRASEKPCLRNHASNLSDNFLKLIPPRKTTKRLASMLQPAR